MQILWAKFSTQFPHQNPPAPKSTRTKFRLSPKSASHQIPPLTKFHPLNSTLPNPAFTKIHPHPIPPPNPTDQIPPLTKFYALPPLIKFLHQIPPLTKFHPPNSTSPNSAHQIPLTKFHPQHPPSHPLTITNHAGKHHLTTCTSTVAVAIAIAFPNYDHAIVVAISGGAE